MTREERIEKLRHLIICMKCEVSGKPCDNNCPTQYDAGHTGEIIENLEEIAKALEQESCEDAISRKEVLETFGELLGVWGRRALMELPSVQPQPKIGHWVGHREHCENLGVIPSGLGAYEWCSNCDCGIDVREWHENNYNFCPNCGADMREVEE